MKKFILDLRKRPEHIRRQILYIATLASAGILFLLWVLSLGSNVSDSGSDRSLKDDLKPFSLLKDGIVDSAKDLTWPISSEDSQE